MYRVKSGTLVAIVALGLLVFPSSQNKNVSNYHPPQILENWFRIIQLLVLPAGTL